MALRRLAVRRDDGDGPRALTGVPAPVRGRGRACSLAQVLAICLDRAGLRLGYDAIMGLSGLAFRPPRPSDDDALAAEERAAIEALAAALDPPLRIHEPPSDEALTLVMTAVDAGLPCAAVGWGSEKDAWAVICGYDRSRQRLLGHCLLDGPRAEYESWPPDPAFLVTMDGAPRPKGPEAIRATLLRAAASWEDVVAPAWERWISRLRALADAPLAPDQEDEACSVAVHLSAASLLMDARTAAQGFLRAIADYQEPLCAAWLLRAAEGYGRVVELLEAGAPLPEEMPADPAQREAWVDRLASAARLDATAFGDLGRAWSADYPPDEADLP